MARVGPADRDVDQGADRVVPVGLDPVARRQDRNQKAILNR